MKIRTMAAWVLVTCGGVSAAPVTQACGDCNRDGQVSILDALASAQHAVGLLVLTGSDFRACDVSPMDGDGTVEILDTLTLAQVASGVAIPLGCTPPLSTAWEHRSGIGYSDHAYAYDRGRGVTVSFGYWSCEAFGQSLGKLLEHDGSRWRRRYPAITPSSPTGAFDHANMAYDEDRGVVVAAVQSFEQERSTWEWNGFEWTQRHPRRQPSSPFGGPAAGMVFDSIRRRILHYGGDGVWAYSNGEWNLVAAQQPGWVWSPLMAFDRARDRIVLLVDQGYPIPTQTWEWDGATWTQRYPATNPIASWGSGWGDDAIAYDERRGMTVLVSLLPGSYHRAVWEWDGNDWVLKTPATVPPHYSIAYPGAVYDPRREVVVVHGGVDGALQSWTWDGVRWAGTTTQKATPPSEEGHTMAFHAGKGEAILFGGQAGRFTPTRELKGETWAWDGNTWEKRLPSSSPPPLYFPTSSYDSDRQVIVMFGGQELSESGPESNATWEWDGEDWHRRFPATSPEPRTASMMAYDSWRRRTVLFGGYSVVRDEYLGDTWEWEGADWVIRTPTTQPEPRFASGIAFDSQRGVMVMAGGFMRGIPRELTWEWDGNDWRAAGAWTSPLPGELDRYSPLGTHMTFDARRGHVLVRSLVGDDGTLVTRVWDGQSWKTEAMQTLMLGLERGAMCFDVVRQVNVWYGPGGCDDQAGSVWEY